MKGAVQVLREETGSIACFGRDRSEAVIATGFKLPTCGVHSFRAVKEKYSL